MKFKERRRKVRISSRKEEEGRTCHCCACVEKMGTKLKQALAIAALTVLTGLTGGFSYSF
jgi:hypothetical protein